MRINDEYGKLPGSYLFAEIARRLKLYQKQHPDADVSDDETAALPDVSGDAADGSAPDETDGQ